MLLFVFLLLLIALLAVFKPVGFEVQLAPLYSSVAPVGDPVFPPKAKVLLFEYLQPAIASSCCV
jgi:hypothetical protein